MRHLGESRLGCAAAAEWSYLLPAVEMRHCVGLQGCRGICGKQLGSAARRQKLRAA